MHHASRTAPAWHQSAGAGLLMALPGPHATHLCSSLSSSSSGLPGLLCPTCLCTPAPLDTTSAFWCLLLTAACCCTTWRLAGLPLARLQARLGCWLATVLARLLCWPPAPHRPACNTCMPLQAPQHRTGSPGLRSSRAPLCRGTGLAGCTQA